MTWRPLIPVLLIAAAVLGACNSGGPRVEMLKPEALATARTFGPMAGQALIVQGEGIPADVGRWIAEAATAELESRGYRRSENPDLVGRALVAVAEKKGQWIETSSPGSLPRPVIQTYDWTEGTLILELFDRRTGELVWRGIAREAVSPGTGEAQVRRAIRRMFAGFPAAR